ncbi:MOSC domain-containing protein [Saccharothrix syringae]|uniref:MOSC domain-containing protein n=1 Tax=Saccharothrix syringae TaxID=103733 RepID=UPI00068F2D64|nr:MOSC domain-containing protein [Saccharothrix syringae]
MVEGGRVAGLYVYPIKGLSAQPLTSVPLRRGEGVPHDRALALARPGGAYHPGLRRGLPKTEFYALVAEHHLAGLRTHLDVGTGVFTAEVVGHEVLSVRLPDEQDELLRFFARVLDLPDGVLPVPAREEGRRFTDTARVGDRQMNWISLLNLASVRDLAERAGVDGLDPRRFRANVLLDGLPPWAEEGLVDREFTLGGVRLRGTSRTWRCAATEVDPDTGRRDLPVVRMLNRAYGHEVMGCYAEVLSDGVLEVGGELVA